MKKNQKILVVGNWKMNPGSLDEAKKRFQSIKKAAAQHPGSQVVVCPPFPFISALAQNKAETLVGAQDASIFEEGSQQTGEVGVKMLESAGAEYIILGHSERRAAGDTSTIISKKIQQALKTSMKIIVCFGEKERDSDGGYLEVIKAQLKDVLTGINRAQFSQIILAYEPVWAIGRTDNVAITSYDLHQMVVFVRKTLRDMFGDTIASMMPILYGGSANPQNGEDIMHNGEVNGLLVGRASWQADTFGALFNAINGGKEAKNRMNLAETLIKAKINKKKRYNERAEAAKKAWKNPAKKVAKTVKKVVKKSVKKVKKAPKKILKKFSKKHNAKSNKKARKSKARRSKR